MNIYSFLSIGYDLLDILWFSDRGKNPRDVIKRALPNENCKVLDMCCGTFTNGLSIARENNSNMVVGLDRSKAMLREAKRKIRKENLKNVKLLCRDATKTGIKGSSFDYIVIGLVLHECNPDLWEGILNEAHRLLKDDGLLVVLEWDKQNNLGRRIKFAPLYVAEILTNPKHFRQFYNSDKVEFFGRYGFNMLEKHECNYSSVMVMNKK